MGLKPQPVLEFPESLLKTQRVNPTPEFASAGVGQSLRICSSKQFPGDVDIAGLEIML